MAQMRFCKECNNILYPKEDKEEKTLKMICRNCATTEEATTQCVYRNEIIADTSTKLEIFQEDLSMDCTLSQTTAATCPKCGENRAVHFRAHGDKKASKMHLVFICIGCRHKWLQ